MEKNSPKTPRRKIISLDQRGASLTEMGLLVGLISVVSIGSVNTLGVKVACIFENASAALAAREWDPTCAARMIIADGAQSEDAYALTFNDPEIEPDEASDVTITAKDLQPGAQVLLTVREGNDPVEGSPSSVKPASIAPASAKPVGAEPASTRKSITRTATATAETHDFTGLDLTGFKRGPVSADITVTRNGHTKERAAVAASYLKVPLKLAIGNPVHHSRFGHEVAMNGTIAFVSAPYDNSAGTGNIGKVLAFDRETGAELFAIADAPERDTQYFGMALAANDSYLAVKADNTDGARVHVFDMSGAYLFEVDNDFSMQNTTSFGQDIRIVGNTLIVADFLAGGGAGAIHTFDLTRNGALVWSAVGSSNYGLGINFDVEGGTLFANNRNVDFVNEFDLSDGSLTRTWSRLGTANDHLEVVGNTMITGTGSAMNFTQLSPPQFTGTGSAVGASGGFQAFEGAGSLLLVNSGVQSHVSIVDPIARAVIGTIDFPDELGSSLPSFGHAIHYGNGQVLVGAPSHGDPGDSIRPGAAYIFDMP